MCPFQCGFKPTEVIFICPKLDSVVRDLGKFCRHKNFRDRDSRGFHDFDLARNWVAREASNHIRANERDRVKFEKRVRNEKGKSGGKPGKGKVKGKISGKGKGKGKVNRGSKGNLDEPFSPSHPTFTDAEIRAFTDEEFMNIISESSTLRFAFIWGDLPQETLVERCASNPLSEIEKVAQENVPWRGTLRRIFSMLDGKTIESACDTCSFRATSARLPDSAFRRR